jgi:hypothetical protein
VTDVVDNVTIDWLARQLIEFRNETRHELRSLLDDVDKLSVIVRSMRHEMDVTAVTLVKIERHLDRLENEREP